MLMLEVAKHWTAADLAALPDDGKRYEIVGGELFMSPAPAWRHQIVVGRLHVALVPYVETHRIGTAVLAPADVDVSDDTVVEPDMFVVPLVDGRAPRRWSDVNRLLLAIEVLSPSTARLDRVVKRKLYQRIGAGEYWIVDPDSALIERWRPDDERPEVLHERIEWLPDGATGPLALHLTALFAE